MSVGNYLADMARRQRKEETLETPLRAYAEIHVHDASTAQSIANGTTYIKLTAFTQNGLSINCTADQANDRIVFVYPGTYRVTFHVSGTSGTANLLWRCAPFLDGVEQDNVHDQDDVVSANSGFSLDASGFITVTAGQVLDLRVRHSGGGATNITVTYANLNVELI